MQRLESTAQEIAVRVVCDFGTHMLSNVTQNEVSSDLARCLDAIVAPICSSCTKLGVILCI